MKQVLSVLLLISGLFSPSALAADIIKNLGNTAKISASGQYSQAYNPKYMSDGKIPEANSHQDQREAWCVPQALSKEAWVNFEWKKPVQIESVVYWGRCAWMTTENFSACQVYVNGAERPTTSVTLVRGPQAQVITLPAPVNAKQIRLVFPSNFGGSNPGASEIGIFAATPSKAQLAQYESPEPQISYETL